jgi:YVTN family beta-propeller protein
MQFRILGPLDVRDGEKGVELGGGRQRGLLALLLIHANEAVSSHLIAEELWGDAAPASVAKVIQNHVSSLRRALGDARIQTSRAGYTLLVQADELDADQFERLLGEGKVALGDSDPEVAAGVFRDALALWRGRALSDFVNESFSAAEATRLDERRLEAVEERIDADLELGRHSDLVAELEQLVGEHPLRERLRGQLMLALYRTGRQAEALNAYQAARRTLVDELGIEPGPALRQLHTEILNQEPTLDPPARPTETTSARVERILTPAWLMLVGGVLLLAAVAGFVVAARSDDSAGAALASVQGNSVGVIDPTTNDITAQIPVGATPTSVAVGEGSVWVLNADAQTLSRIDPVSRSAETFGTGTFPTDVTAGEGAVWIGNGGKASPLVAPAVATSISQLDPSRGDVRRTIPLPAADGDIHNLVEDHTAVGAGAVWAINPDSTISRIEPRLGLARRITGVEAIAVASDGQAVWTLNIDGTVSRVDRKSLGKPIRVAANVLTDIAVGGGSVWLADPYDGLVWRIGTTPRVAMRTIDVGAGVDHLAFGAGSLWATNSSRGTVQRIDPATNRVAVTIPIGNTPRNLAVGAGAVWVTVAGSPGATVPSAQAAAIEGVRALPRSTCGGVFYGGDERPDYLIASDLPLQAGEAFPTLQMSEAVAYVLRRHRFRAGPYRIAYQSCDDSTAQNVFDPNKCIANAKEYVANPDVLGVVGPYNSGCAFEQIATLNRARLALVSPTNSAEDLTRPTPAAPPDLERRLYPTGARNYFRVVPTDSAQGAANAVLARQLGIDSVFILHDGTLDFGVPKAIFFRRAARRIGLELSGFRQWGRDPASYGRLAADVKRSGAQGIFLAGGLYLNGGSLIRALRARMPGVRILAPEFLPITSLFDGAGPAARGVYVSFVGLTNDRLSATGRRFMREFGATQPGSVDRNAAYTAEATEVLLEAIARSDGTRASVVRELHELRVEDGILGDFEFTPTGDTTSTPISIFRAERGGGANVIEGVEGAVLDRVIEPPPRLTERARG